MALLTVKNLSDRLGISPSYIYKKIKSGDYQFRNIGGYRFTEDDVNKILKSHENLHYEKTRNNINKSVKRKGLQSRRVAAWERPEGQIKG